MLQESCSWRRAYQNQSPYMVLKVVAGLKNGELVMAGVVGGDCRDKMADRLPRSYTVLWYITGKSSEWNVEDRRSTDRICVSESWNSHTIHRRTVSNSHWWPSKWHCMSTLRRISFSTKWWKTTLVAKILIFDKIWWNRPFWTAKQLLFQYFCRESVRTFTTTSENIWNLTVMRLMSVCLSIELRQKPAKGWKWKKRKVKVII